MANRNYPKNVAATTVIPFDNPITAIPQKTITAATTFTKATTGAQVGYGAMIEVVADGSHVPDLSAFDGVGTGSYDNTAGVVNLLTFFYTGSRYCVAVNPVTVSGGGLTQLSTPSAFTATPSGSSVNLSWSDVSNETGYKVYWNAINDFGSAALATTTAANAGTYTKTGLSSGPWYFWVVAAGDGVTYSDSNPASASATVTSGATALNAPTGVTLGTATDTTQPLTWTDTNTSPNENGYKVYRNTANNFSTATLATTTAANATSYTVTGLTASTLYYYWVVAAGNGTTTADSSPSTVASGSTTSGGATLEDLVFTGQVAETSTGSHIWQQTAGTGSIGIATKSIASGVDGGIQFRRESGTFDNALFFGLTTGSVAVAYTAMDAAMLIDASGNVYSMDPTNGFTSRIGAISIGDYVRIDRTGTAVKLQWSATGTSWTDEYTFPLTSSAQLHIVVDTFNSTSKVLVYPKGYNVS
jgi:hypothetical protein